MEDWMRRSSLIITTLIAGAAAVAFAADPAGASKAASATEAKDLRFMLMNPANPKGSSMAVVFGDPRGPGPVQVIIKMPAGFNDGVHSHSKEYHAVVLSGTASHGDTVAGVKPHAPGSTWYEPGKHDHVDICTSKEECMIVVTLPAGPFDYTPAEAHK
jgi:uncharacterized protein DUF4437